MPTLWLSYRGRYQQTEGDKNNGKKMFHVQLLSYSSANIA
ncbi:hypothetical protein HMPREF0650_2177 [Hoylesella buccalis ATCC 35310]|uniref:Uncharacterized protein n=1 Tax=Hoylesella buccalis ATCC 35310 TaxID=679190 RepID=D1W4U8_9BACT|nr:hypothetical protein HMPREF0650_2177 [Hoylesella buccalis ATCC 35310]